MKKVDYMLSERAKPVVLFILYYNYFLSFGFHNSEQNTRKITCGIDNGNGLGDLSVDITLLFFHQKCP